MLTELLFATCESRPAFTEDDGVLAAALSTRGITVRACPWPAIGLSTNTLGVLFRSTWDYHLRPREFAAWLGRIEKLTVPVLNPVPLIRWNMDKSYLRELEAAGIALPRTVWIGPPGWGDSSADTSVDPRGVQKILEERGWERAVLKPRIGATAHGTHLLSRSALVDPSELSAIQEVGGLLQEYLFEIEEEGELSLVYLAGEFSHAVCKRPRAGDFRVQHEFGGTITAAIPSRASLGLAERALSTLRESWVYARVDLVESRRGPVLMELELIEPDLFFRTADGSADRLAEALAVQLLRRP